MLSDRSESRYTELKLDLVLKTLRTLHARIVERFPGSGLGRIAAELEGVALATGSVVERVHRPNLLMRAAAGVAVALVLVLGAGPFYLMRKLDLSGVADVGELFQAVEAATQCLIFLAIAVYFPLTLETRVKRNAVLGELHRLRSIVHVVDMHQLTKDPENLFSPSMTTASSPERNLSRFELARYLDYCSELLAIASKLAAFYAQHLPDPVVLAAVSDVEVLSSNLSNKIWQKIMIVDTALRPQSGPV